MKILVELNTDVPEHKQLLHNLLNSGPETAGIVAPVQSPAPTVPVAPVPPTPAPNPTPVSDLQKELQAAFAKAYAQKGEEAMTLANQIRSEFGPDANGWSEEQLRQAVSRTQALCTF